MILREKLENKIFNNKNSLKNLYALVYNLFKIKLNSTTTKHKNHLNFNQLLCLKDSA